MNDEKLPVPPPGCKCLEPQGRQGCYIHAADGPQLTFSEERIVDALTRRIAKMLAMAMLDSYTPDDYFQMEDGEYEERLYKEGKGA